MKYQFTHNEKEYSVNDEKSLSQQSEDFREFWANAELSVGIGFSSISLADIDIIIYGGKTVIVNIKNEEV